VALLVSWGAIGFAGLLDYPALTRLVGEKTGGPRGMSITTLAHELGLTYGAGRALQVACGLAVLAAVFAVARREEGDRRSFALAVTGALLLSPLLWIHYLALLLVPLAIARPRFDSAWTLPTAMWLIAFMPLGPAFVVRISEHTVGVFGTVPSAPKVAFVLAFLAALTAISAAPPRALPVPARLPLRPRPDTAPQHG
jgi:hypothetical protein